LVELADSQLALQLLDLLVLELDQVDEHLFVVAEEALFDVLKLRLLHLNDFGGVALVHFNLGLSQSLVLVLESLVLLLEVYNCLAQLLHLTCRLGLGLFSDFLVFS